MPRLIDAHTHAQFTAYDNDWKEVIDRSLAQNIWLVNVGTQKDTSAKAVEIAEKYNEGVYATVGLHPIHTEKSFHDEQELGITTYPTFLVNNQIKFSGVQAADTIKEKFCELNVLGECSIGLSQDIK